MTNRGKIFILSAVEGSYPSIKTAICSLSKTFPDSDIESPKSHVHDFSAFSPNLVNFTGSDGLTRFLQTWLIDWLTLPAKESQSFNLSMVMTWCLFASMLFPWSRCQIRWHFWSSLEQKWDEGYICFQYFL